MLLSIDLEYYHKKIIKRTRKKIIIIIIIIINERETTKQKRNLSLVALSIPRKRSIGWWPLVNTAEEDVDDDRTDDDVGVV